MSSTATPISNAKTGNGEYSACFKLINSYQVIFWDVELELFTNIPSLNLISCPMQIIEAGANVNCHASDPKCGAVICLGTWPLYTRCLAYFCFKQLYAAGSKNCKAASFAAMSAQIVQLPEVTRLSSRVIRVLAGNPGKVCTCHRAWKYQ